MKITQLFRLFMVAPTMFAFSAFADFVVELEGGPSAGNDPEVFDPAAPIYTLNGEATANFGIGPYKDISVNQKLVFTMDNVNGGRVHTVGNAHITKAGSWDATFLADSWYSMATYGRLIIVNFNHKLNKDPNELMLVDGEPCDSGYITSAGSMKLLSDYTFDGLMRGQVLGRRNGRVIKNYSYRDEFDQNFTDLVVEDQGVWSAEYSILELARNRLKGSGTIEVGPAENPVDIVEQNVAGTKNPRTGVFTWTTTSKSRADSKVKVTIRNTASDLVPNANSVSAAAQTRKF